MARRQGLYAARDLGRIRRERQNEALTKALIEATDLECRRSRWFATFG